MLEQVQAGALSGNLEPVVRFVESSDENDGDELTQTLTIQFRERFMEAGSPQAMNTTSPLVGSVAALYHQYWRKVLLGEASADQAETELRFGLERLLQDEYAGFATAKPVFEQVEPALATQGAIAATSFTAPMQDLYIWTSQQTQDFSVLLTDSEQTVPVTFIEDLLVQGWQHYASLGLSATSGWATQDGLYCLCWSYDLDTEAFQVSWLKHEARHLVDLQEFPHMGEVQLEYRAKLTELAFTGNSVGSLLRHFAENGVADGQSVHAAANYRVSHDIYREIFDREMPRHLDPWMLLGPDRVAPAAIRLLERDTASLRQDAALLAP